MLHLKDFNLEDLAMALENHFMDYETFFWVDPATGKMELWAEGVADEAEAEGWDVHERGGVRIDPIDSFEAYRDMEEFISTVSNQDCRNRLGRAIDRSKPFRHFRETLSQFHDEESEWLTFHDNIMKRRAIEWLNDKRLVESSETDAALSLLQSAAGTPRTVMEGRPDHPRR